MKYTHASYSMGFAVDPRLEDALVTRPGWFARVILRRKPQSTRLFLSVARDLGKAAAAVEQDLVRRILEDGNPYPGKIYHGGRVE